MEGRRGELLTSVNGGGRGIAGCAHEVRETLQAAPVIDRVELDDVVKQLGGCVRERIARARALVDLRG
jgi:hypothetical protein